MLVEGNCVFLRAWDSMYDDIVKSAARLDIAATYPPGDIRAATLGGWGISIANMSKSKNKCRKQTTVKMIRWLTNKTFQAEFMKKFQRTPTFDKEFIATLCKNATKDSIICKLNNFVSDKTMLVSRPIVSEAL